MSSRGEFDDMPFPFDVLNRLLFEHLSAPDALRARFDACVSLTVATDALAHLARVRFESHRFDFDEDGRWAIVLPVYDGGDIVDFGAFSVDGDDIRRPYTAVGSVGFESALWDAHYHPQRRFLLHHDAWSYLRAECTGCVPISWRKTAIELLTNDIRSVIYPDELQAAKGHLLLAAALQPPRPHFVKAKAAA
jgi:hypothetical protein